MSPNRIEVVDFRHNRQVIIEAANEGLEFWEKEFGGVQWFRVKQTETAELQRLVQAQVSRPRAVHGGTA